MVIPLGYGTQAGKREMKNNIIGNAAGSTIPMAQP